jgi:hypothetical protein
MKSFLKKHGSAVFACLLIIGLYGLMFAFGITCPIRYVFGVSCPGCGMTRACISALRLDFTAAFAYHPLWVLMVPTAVFIVLCRWRGWRRALHVGVMAVALLLCAVYVLRMVWATSEVVVFAPKSGLLWKAITFIFGGTSR